MRIASCGGRRVEACRLTRKPELVLCPASGAEQIERPRMPTDCPVGINVRVRPLGSQGTSLSRVFGCALRMAMGGGTEAERLLVGEETRCELREADPLIPVPGDAASAGPPRRNHAACVQRTPVRPAPEGLTSLRCTALHCAALCCVHARYPGAITARVR